MDATAELGRNPASKKAPDSTRVWRWAGWRGTGLPNPFGEIKFSGANERGPGNNMFPCSAHHEQDWKPYRVDPYSWYIYVWPATRQTLANRPNSLGRHLLLIGSEYDTTCCGSLMWANQRFPLPHASDGFKTDSVPRLFSLILLFLAGPTCSCRYYCK